MKPGNLVRTTRNVICYPVQPDPTLDRSQWISHNALKDTFGMVLDTAPDEHWNWIKWIHEGKVDWVCSRHLEIIP